MTATEAAAAPAAGPAAPAGEPGPLATPWWRRTWVVGAALLALLAIPLAVGLGVLHSPRWYPILDLAQTELRVRDVGTRHTPLVGLAGRIESQGVRGSHPGPLSFYGLRPVYTLLGERSWGLQVSTAVVHLAAMATALWIAARRGGVRLMVAMGAVLAVLGHLYGATTLTEAWNPLPADHVVAGARAGGLVGAVRRPGHAAGGGVRRVVVPPDPHLLPGPGRRPRGRAGRRRRRHGLAAPPRPGRPPPPSPPRARPAAGARGATG